MASWTQDELTTVGGAEELHLASRRQDGSLRPFVTMWVVRAGDGLFVRSAYGPDNPWYRRAKASGSGRVRAGGVERDVRFEDAEPSDAPAIDRAYHAKYDRHGPAIVGTVTGPDKASLTIRLVPADAESGGPGM